jgi:hypothetical protein
MNPILGAKIAVAVIALLVSFYIGKKMEQNYWLQREAEIVTSVLEEKEALEKKGKLLSEAYQQQRDIATASQKKLTVEVRNETKKSDYTCALPPDGLRILKSAIDTANGSK